MCTILILQQMHWKAIYNPYGNHCPRMLRKTTL